MNFRAFGDSRSLGLLGVSGHPGLFGFFWVFAAARASWAV